MSKKKIAAVVPLILLFFMFNRADVPPDPGYVRQSVDLVAETTEDVSDFRFFLDFYGDLREVEIKSKGRTEIPPMGGGARYRTGTLLGVPKKSLGNFEGKLSNEQLSDLSKALKANEIQGVAELARHRFSDDVPKGAKPPETFYRLKREENTLKAEKITEERSASDSSSSLTGSASRAGLVVGGVLLALAVLAVGVSAFRKVSKKV